MVNFRIVLDRYSRQILFPSIGKEGQRKLSSSYVVVIGCGALGSIISTSLVRAGVGKIRIIDRDFIEYHNLQRQLLFDEEDIRNELPKAIAAERHLKKVNSSIDIEGIVADVNFTNIEKLIKGADIVLDGLDNYETRFLINDASLKLNIPWIYGGAIASFGMTKVIIPHETSCFRCLVEELPPTSTIMTCDTAGVISPAPFIVGSLQTVEALKLLIGSNKTNKDLIVVDVWEVKFDRFNFKPLQDCPACQGQYDFLKGKYEIIATSICGQNAVQVLNPKLERLSLDKLAKQLKPLGKVSHNKFMLHFTIDKYEIIVFPEGRAIVKNTAKESIARALYSKYIGA